MWARFKKQSGFTIVELAVIVAVIGILAAVTVFTYRGAYDRGQNTKTTSAAKDYLGGLALYYNRYGTYPSIPNGSSYMCLGNKYPAGPSGPDCVTNAQPTLPMDQKLIEQFDDLPPEPSLKKYTNGSYSATGVFLSVEPKTLDGVVHNRWMVYILGGNETDNLCTVGEVAYGNWLGTSLSRTGSSGQLPGTFAGTFRMCAVPLPVDR